MLLSLSNVSSSSILIVSLEVDCLTLTTDILTKRTSCCAHVTLAVLTLKFLDLEYYFVHELTRFLHLRKLFVKVHIEAAQVHHLLSIGVCLDFGEQVVGYIVRLLKNMVLLTVNLAHGTVLNPINCRILLFDEVLHAFQTVVHSCDRLLNSCF